MTETPNLGLYTTDINEASEAGMSLFKILELLLGAGYITKSNMEKVDEGFGILKNKLSNYTSENVYITDHQKEGIENKQNEFNWNKNSQVEYIAKLLGGHEKCVLTIENTNITSDKSDILFNVTQGFSKLNNVATSGISEIQLVKSLLCERIVLDIKNDNESIVNLTVYITVNGNQTPISMSIPAKASVQKSFYNSIVRDLDDNSTIKFQAQTDGLPLIINSDNSKAQYDYIDIDKISNLGDNFSDIIDNVYNELRSDIDSNSVEIDNVSGRTTSLEANLYNPNLLINSNFKVSELVSQRGNTVYTGGWGYFVDMLEVYAGVSGHNANINNEYLRLETTTGAYTVIRKKVEKLGKGMYTLSARIKGTMGENIQLQIQNSSGAVIKGQTFTLSGDWQTLSVVAELTEDYTMVQVLLWFNKVNGNGILDIDYMKLESGEVATKFVDDETSIKLTKCQRYFEKSYNINIAPQTPTGVGTIPFVTASTKATGAVSFKNRKRINPTIKIYAFNGEEGKVLNSSSNLNESYTNIGSNSEQGFNLYKADCIANNVYYFHYTASAEL